MERVDADLVPFAQNNPSGYRFAFGTDTATDDINANYNDNIKKGWGTTPNEFPEVEDFNAMAYTTGYLLSYLYQMGIAEWNDKQKYRQYSRVIGSDGIVYKAKTGTDISPNIGNNPTTDTTNWEIDNQFNINSLASKATPIDTDNFGIQEVGGLFKKISWANIKATLKTYFDTLYTVASTETVAGIIELATTAETQAGTDDTGAITPLKLKNSVFGLGQTWQNVTGNRIDGVTYHNTSGKPIEIVLIRITITYTGYWTLLVDGVIAVESYTSSGVTSSATVTVPNGSTYSTNSISGVSTKRWVELR